MRSSSFFRFWLGCFHIASSCSSEVHKFVDAHFYNQRYGIDLYFCKFNDAFEYLKLVRNHTIVTRRVKVMSIMEKDDEPPEAHTFVNRASVFLDASCAEGLQLLGRNKLKMSHNFRWLIFTEDVLSIYQTLESSRLEMDSDVTLIKRRNDTFEFLRLTRMHVKTNFNLPANYSLEETMRNEKLSQAILWRGEEISFGNYSFDALNVFLKPTYYKLEDWSLMLNKSVDPGPDNIRKYFTHPFVYLMDMYNFTLNVTIAEDWGLPQPNGSFSGAFGMIERREFEFGLTAVRPLTSRLGVVDFSVSLLESRFVFILIQPKTFGTPAALIVPFQSKTWLVFLLLIIVLTAVMRISILSDKDQHHNDSWGGSILLVFGGISQNGIPDTASKLSSRSIHLVTLTSLFLIFLYYSTAVLNGLILPSPDPIQNIQQLISSNTELCGQDVIYIRRELSINDSLTQSVRNKLIPQKYLLMDEGVQRMRRGSFAFYGLDRDLREAIDGHVPEDEKCLITEIPMIRGFQLCLFWRKMSPFGEIINRGLLKMNERGILYHLQKYWLVQKSKCTVSLNFAPINLKAMTMAYGVLALGLVVCLNIFIFEILIVKVQRRREQWKLPFVS